MSALAPTLQAFFTDRLIRQREASPQTVATYRDALKMLVAFAATRATKQPWLLDIADLDDAGAEKQGKSAPAKEFLNLVQILRTIGGFLDKHEARLVRLTNNEVRATEQSVKIEYISRDGERVLADRTGSALYDMCVAIYKQRGRLTGTGGRFSRWRR